MQHRIYQAFPKSKQNKLRDWLRVRVMIWKYRKRG